MTQKTSGILAVTLLAMLSSFVAALSGNFRVASSFDAAEIFGGSIAIPLVSAFLALVMGLVGGAMKEGAFKNTFFWCYITLASILTVLSIILSVRNFN
jgi:hypothetical protein